MILVINGKPIEVAQGSSLKDIQKEFFRTSDVVIINGFQTNENIVLQDQDVLTFIEKGKMPNKEEFESFMSARHTPEVYEKVKKAKVAVAGLGGLGSNIAIMLARTGLGELLLVDFDQVEPSNLNRQCYTVKHLGLDKTEALKMQIEEINPFITVKIKTVKVSYDNLTELFSGYEVVCEAFDNPKSKAMLVNGLLQELDCKVVASSGMAGYFSSNSIRTEKKFNRLYVCGDGEHEAKQGSGLMAPRVSICAGHQANMVLRLLLDIESV